MVRSTSPLLVTIKIVGMPHHLLIVPTWSKPNKRFLSQDIYMPSYTCETVPYVAFATDLSGSMGQDEITEFGNGK